MQDVPTADEAVEIPRVRGVVRIDIMQPKQTHGWQARIYLGRTARTKFFSDNKYGGREKSHTAAADALSLLEVGLPPKVKASPTRRRAARRKSR